MSDYRLIIRVKNNLLLKLMNDNGIETQSELARVVGVQPTMIGNIANLKIGAFNADGRPSKITEKLCEYFGCLPEDIYPPEVLHVGIPNNVLERVVSSEEVSRYLQQVEIDPAFQLENMVDSKFLKQQLSRLTPWQQKVIEALFFEGKSVEDVGRDFDISRTRVCQIRELALKKLQRILTHESGDHDLDSTAAGLATRLADAVKNENALNDSEQRKHN